MNVVDGDTFDANVDLGFGIFTRQRFRIKGIDAPELCMTDFTGERSKQYLTQMINNKTVTIISSKTDSFGRYLADVYIIEGTEQINVATYMIEHGMAQVY